MLMAVPSWKAANPQVCVAAQVVTEKMEVHPKAAKSEEPLVQRLAKFAGKPSHDPVEC